MWIAHLAGSSKTVGTAFAQAQVLDLALVLQLLHGLDGGFDGLAGVQSMGVVQVDLVDAQPPQRLVAGLPHVLGLVPHGSRARLGIDKIAKLGGQEDVLALARVVLEPLAQEILAVAVHVGRVPEPLARVVDVVEHGEALLVRLGCAVEGAEAHGAEAQGRDFRSILAELARVRCHCDR